jgi:hypothetical protein
VNCTGWWFSPGTSVSSTNKPDLHDMTEILLKGTINTIIQTTVNSYKVVGTNTVVIKGKVNMTIYPAMIISAVE